MILKMELLVIGEDYYLKALEMMPKDTPVLIFTSNDKSDIFYMENTEPLSNGDSSGREYILVEDILSDRSSVVDDWSYMILTQSSPQFGLYDSDPRLNSLYLDHLVDFDGKSNYRYDHASTALISYSTDFSDSEEDTETSLVYTDTTQYKIDNHLYNYSFDLCLMSMCNYHIAANILYGFWGINLSDSKKILYPKYWSQGMVDIVKNLYVIIHHLVVLDFNVIRTLLWYLIWVDLIKQNLSLENLWMNDGLV